MYWFELLRAKVDGGKTTGGRSVSGAKDWRQNIGDETFGFRFVKLAFLKFSSGTIFKF